jgi:hypothetical protein
MKLTDPKIERQDFVDNSIFSLLKSLNPSNNDFDWDIEMISDIRDNISYWLINKTKCSEQEFYPFIEEE